MNRSSFILLLLAGCQASPSASSTPGALPGVRWILVERPYEEVEPWIQDSGDAALAGDATTLVFEPVLLQASRCPHRLRISGDIPDRWQVGETVKVSLSIDCDPGDVHRVEVIPTRPGIRVLGFHGALGELPNLSGFYVRGSARVSVEFTADSQGLGGIKAVLSEAPK
jgi:hypothetical protein